MYQASQQLGARVRVGFIVNYDMWTGALLTSGVDVWLNTPLRPHEASGTSGMKAALNGVPNASVLDGWWAEAADHGQNGWVIGNPEVTDDEADTDALYRILEEQIIPTYYDNRARWTEIMKNAITSGARFTAQRMVNEYTTRFYK